LAVEEINAAGGVKGLGKIDAILGDAQSTPDGGVAEVEKMNSANVCCIVGGYASNICLATTQAAARYELPYVVDCRRRRRNCHSRPQEYLQVRPWASVSFPKPRWPISPAINEQAGKPAKTVMIVHEDSLFGSGLAKLLNAQLPQQGFEILETIPHPTPTRDFNNVVLKIKAQNPDLVIPRKLL
jgi:branched-chain amino acid transport system substrate-binding protein